MLTCEEMMDFLDVYGAPQGAITAVVHTHTQTHGLEDLSRSDNSNPVATIVIMLVFPPENPRIVRNLLCFCPGLNIWSGVTPINTCRVCHKLVMIINLWDYHPYRKCTCARKMTNEFFFCELCKCVACNDDGTISPDVITVITRAQTLINVRLLFRPT